MQVDSYNDIPIYLVGGWFTATIGEQSLKDRTLNGLQAKLSLLEKPIDAMIPDNYSGIRMPQRVLVVYDKKARRFRNSKNGRLLDRYDRPFHYDKVAEEQLKKIAAEYSELMQRWNDMISKLAPVKY